MKNFTKVLLIVSGVHWGIFLSFVSLLKVAGYFSIDTIPTVNFIIGLLFVLFLLSLLTAFIIEIASIVHLFFKNISKKFKWIAFGLNTSYYIVTILVIVWAMMNANRW